MTDDFKVYYFILKTFVVNQSSGCTNKFTNSFGERVTIEAGLAGEKLTTRISHDYMTKS